MPNINNIMAPEPSTQELPMDRSLRPKSLFEYIGQHDIKSQIAVFIEASKLRSEALDHTILYGPPGLGKTTLALIIAKELGVNIHNTSGPAIEKTGDLATLLTNLETNDVLFIDEIHRLSSHIEEILYPAMEDFRMDIVVGEGMAARSVKLDLPRFTLVGATTRVGMLSNPLRDRFGIILRLEFYNEKDLQQIINRSACLLKCDIDDEASMEIAKSSRGTPRIANRLLRRVRDFAQINGEFPINIKQAKSALARLNVDIMGLDVSDRRFLTIMIERFNGGPVGIEAIAASMAEDVSTIEDMVEPYLLQKGYIKRTARGRVATDLAYNHMGVSISD